MRHLIGVPLIGMVKEKEKLFLCFEWETNGEAEGVCCIKSRYGNRKFMTTGFKTKDMDSILLLRWKNDADGHSYEMRKPILKKDGDLIRIDLTKEFVAMGLELREVEEKTKRGGGSSNFYDYGSWIHIGEYGYYYAENSGDRTYLDFYFAYPGLEIGNSVITKIQIDTFDSIKNERMKPMYDFMETVMDDLSAVHKYTAEELAELFTEHFPKSMFIDVWCKDKLLRAGLDHLGEPQWRFCREDMVDGVKNSNVPWTKHPKPLELVVKELGL